MKFLEKRIETDGVLINDQILKVDSFINHQIDTGLCFQIAEALTENLEGITKILTIETSGIAFAIAAAHKLGDIPVLFAKKSKSAIVDLDNVYSSEVRSFTRNLTSNVTVSKKYLNENDVVLIIDDFLAEGNAAMGLIDICNQAKAKVRAVGVVIEKRHQGGRDRIESCGVEVRSCASIINFENGKINFYQE